MSQENLKEVEIVTQRIEDPNEQNIKQDHQNDSQSDNPHIPEEQHDNQNQNEIAQKLNTVQDFGTNENNTNHNDHMDDQSQQQHQNHTQNTQNKESEKNLQESNQTGQNTKGANMVSQVKKPIEIKVEGQQYEPQMSDHNSNQPKNYQQLQQKQHPQFDNVIQNGGNKANSPSNKQQNLNNNNNNNNQMLQSQASHSAMPSPSNQDQQNSQRQKSSFSKQQEEERGLFDDDDDDTIKSKFPKVEKFLDSNQYQTFITILTIYALFADDIRVMATHKPADIVFDIFTIFVLVIFAIEIVLASFSKPGYIFSFFFFLDFISTISLIIDIQLFTNQVFYGGNSTTSASASQLAQAGKASRVGTKAGRVVRLVRLIRIVKLYKLSQEQVAQQNDKFQQFKEKRQNKKQHNRLSQKFNQNILNPSDQEQPPSQKRGSVQSPQGTKRESVVQVEKPPQSMFKESRVSRRLSDLTTKRVIILVLLLLFIMPLFTADYYYDQPSSIDFSTQQLQQISQYSTTQVDITSLFNKIIETHRINDVQSHLVYLATPFTFLDDFIDADYEDLRNDEQENYSYDLDLDKFKQNHDASQFTYDYNTLLSELQKSVDKEEAQFQGILNIRSTQIVSAGLSLGRTIFVCIVLTCGALFFAKDANDLALRPIERLIEKVNKIAKNPISAKEQKLVQSDSQFETVIIENAIIKIGVLLALGFGDAGSEIIASNMQKSGDVDPMIPGTKKCAIYGFCDIRNFTDATEVLQEDVMIFVNNIGDVVHSMTDRYQGAANKNIGDAFLLVWKIPMNKYTIDNADNSVHFNDLIYMNKLADMSILSFMKIQVKLNREPKILKYREDKRLQSRMADYKVKLGYGLHLGWGIEGAIGSEFKIDASYLSPNVNMASRLEGASKEYGTPILISSDLCELFTENMRSHTRYIDRVLVKGTSKPFGLYTVDQNLENLPISKNPDTEYEGLTKQDRSEIMRQKKKEIQQFLDYPDEWEWDANLQISENKDLRLAFIERDPAFYKPFEEGFQCYLNGKWGEAKQKFEICKQVKPKDGPMINLLNIMEDHKFQAPSDWKGYRETNL